MPTLSMKSLFRTPKVQKSTYKYRHFLNSVSKDKMREILLFSEGDHLSQMLPDFAGKKVLFFNDQNHKFIFKKILARDPNYMINYVYGGKALQMQSPGYGTIMGDLERMALKESHFDIVICPFALEGERFNEKILQRINQVLKNGGRLILSLRHPQLEHMIFNQNPAQSGAPNNSLSKFFSLFKANSLFTEDIKEGFVDMALKPFFALEGEYDYYHEYKGTPVTLFFRFVKFVKKK